ncbi:MAG: hypothetical protein M5U01_29500 [Ardenticatenaceae bacterium]|nr:hypothetical protein [Ardenticatenaceae bacterium]HBY92638.1 hypothetical protein [Chloroflexota bacterium]
MNRHTRQRVRRGFATLALLLGLLFAGTGLLGPARPAQADGGPTPTPTPVQTGGGGDPVSG